MSWLHGYRLLSQSKTGAIVALVLFSSSGVLAWNLSGSLFWSLGWFLGAALLLGAIVGEAIWRVRMARFSWTLPNSQTELLHQALGVGGSLLIPIAVLAMVFESLGAGLSLLGLQGLAFAVGLNLAVLEIRWREFWNPSWLGRAYLMLFALAIPFGALNLQEALDLWQTGLLNLLFAGLVLILFWYLLRRESLRRGQTRRSYLKALFAPLPEQSPAEETMRLALPQPRLGGGWRIWLRVMLFEASRADGKRWWAPFLQVPALLAVIASLIAIRVDRISLSTDGWSSSLQRSLFVEPSPLVTLWLVILVACGAIWAGRVPRFRTRLRYPLARATLARTTIAASQLWAGSYIAGTLLVLSLLWLGLAGLSGETLPLATLLPACRALTLALLFLPFLQWTSVRRPGNRAAFAYTSLTILVLGGTIVDGIETVNTGGHEVPFLTWLLALALASHGFYWWRLKNLFRTVNLSTVQIEP